MTRTRALPSTGPGTYGSRTRRILPGSQRRKLSELAGMEHLDTVKAYDFRRCLQQFYDTHKAYSEELVCDFEQLALDMCNSSVWEISKVGESLTRNTQRSTITSPPSGPIPYSRASIRRLQTSRPKQGISGT